MPHLDSLSTHGSLLQRLRSGKDHVAWAEFVARYRAPIESFCQGAFGVDRTTAEETAQDVLVKLLAEMRKFEYDASKSFRSWLKTVTANAVRDVFRQRKRAVDRGAGNTGVFHVLKQVPERDNADRLIEEMINDFHRELLTEIEPIVRDRVDRKTWTVYTLTRKGVPPQEAATQLEMNMAAVYQARSRVKRMQRQEIKKILKTRRPPEPTASLRNDAVD